MGIDDDNDDDELNRYLAFKMTRKYFIISATSSAFS